MTDTDEDYCPANHGRNRRSRLVLRFTHGASGLRSPASR